MADAMTSQGINYGLKAIEISLSTTSTVADIVYQALKMFDNDKAISSMNKLIKNNQTEYIMCDVDEMETLRKRLESRGVGIDPDTGKRQEGALSIITKDEIGNERGMIVFNKKYHQLVLSTVRSFYAEREGGLVDPKTLAAYSQGMMKEIHGIDKEELMMFDKQSKAYKVPYCVEGPENGLYTIRFGDRDQDEMEKIRIDTAVIMTSKAGNIYRKQLQYENDNFLKLRYAVLNGIDKDTDTQIMKDSVIVDRSGKTIAFENNGVRCTDTFNMKFYNKNNVQYKQNVNDFICGMQKPVLLTKEQYQAYKLETNKEEFLVETERKLGCPELTKDDLDLIAKEKRERDIIEGKLSQNHPVTMRERMDDFNLEESVFSFSEKERQNYEYNHDKGENIHIDENFFDDAESKYVGWELEDCNKTLDDIEIEEEVIEGHAPTNERIEEDIIMDEIAQTQDDTSPHPDIEH